MGQPRRWLGRWTALTWIMGFTGLVAVAQARPSPVNLTHRADTVEVASGDVSGSWAGTFSLDSTWGLDQRASTRSIPARLHFNPVGDASPTTSSARSVH